MKWFTKLFYPNRDEINKLVQEGRETVQRTRIHSAMIKLTAQDLIAETTAEREKTQERIGPIDDLIAQMDKRRNG